MFRKEGRHGQVLVLSTVMLAVVLSLVGSFVSYVETVRKATNAFSARSYARKAAEAGLQKSVWCLNQTSGTNCGGTYGSSFSGETSVQVGSSFYSTSIATVTSSKKTVTATGYYPSVTKPVSTVTLKTDVITDNTEASFFYGLQTGNGGLDLSNNAFINGNVYANGNVTGSNGAYITGTLFVAGGTALSPDQQQTSNTSDYQFGRVSPTIDIAQSFTLSADNVLNKVSLYIKKTGSPSDMTVYVLANNAGVPSKTVLGSATLSSGLVTTSYGWVDVSFGTPPALVAGQTYWLAIDASTSSTKYWTIGSVTGNDYVNGIGMVSSSWNASTPVWNNAGRDYAFKIWTGGVQTSISGMHVYQDAHAHSITGSVIDGDAYYQTISSSTVHGASHPGSTDPGPADLPISDAVISEWQDAAEAGGTVTGDVNYNSTTVSLGPKKITGNLTVTNNARLTITGTLYVQGNLSLSNNARVALSAGYGASSGVIVVDGTITVGNGTTFQGSGTSGSYILLATTNSSLNAAAPAMSLGNNSASSIFYAPNGMVSISNNASVKEVTAFKLSLSNNASVQYESGLADLNFTNGPGASWIRQSGSTREIH
jgi:Tfp pilus assembly protein PilX